ncbi:MAG: 1-deoxy-D-xylulose-5-phosphate reductoisomerase [Bacillota bacterium]|nr:1-deoxy-D-xylulose-5-phosphate reductoisomerase [Bacillota bacterium]
MRDLIVLGSTGSIGRQALDVVRSHPGRWRVRGLAAGRDVRRLEEQVEEFRPQRVAVADEQAGRELRARLAGTGTEVLAGPGAAAELAAETPGELVVAAIGGVAGLGPVLAAFRAGKRVALANKESLVAGGPVVRRELERLHPWLAGAGGLAVHRPDAPLIPVDSEHSAIFQCLAGAGAGRQVAQLILTASGGPFRGWSREQLSGVTVEQALRHPTWRMGARITVESALLMNKALEVIEAHFLFGLGYDQIDVVIHAQSIVHSLVAFVDGSVLGQLAAADMRLPIQYALTYPERWPSPVRRLDLTEAGRLEFERPDRENFPSLDLGYRAGRAGGTAPAVLNGAQEEAVERFLQGRLPFLAVPEVVGEVLSEHRPLPEPSLDEVLEADRWARERARERMEAMAATW